VRNVELIANCSCVDCSDTSQRNEEDEASGDSNDSGVMWEMLNSPPTIL